MSRVLKVANGDYKIQVSNGGTITLDTQAGGAGYGNVVVKGNLDVLGTTTYIETTRAVRRPTRGHHSAPSQTLNRNTILHTGDSQSATIVDGYAIRRERLSNTFHPSSKNIIIIRNVISKTP
jgi:hypothetical protein